MHIADNTILRVCLLRTIQTREIIVGNGHILQGDIIMNKMLRQRVSLYIHVVMLLGYLPSLDGKLERFVTKKMEKAIAKLESDRLYQQ